VLLASNFDIFVFSSTSPNIVRDKIEFDILSFFVPIDGASDLILAGVLVEVELLLTLLERFILVKNFKVGHHCEPLVLDRRFPQRGAGPGPSEHEREQVSVFNETNIGMLHVCGKSGNIPSSQRTEAGRFRFEERKIKELQSISSREIIRRNGKEKTTTQIYARTLQFVDSVSELKNQLQFTLLRSEDGNDVSLRYNSSKTLRP
jgi:hypothetical protein